MAETVGDRTSIRRLSQYRLFESGGETAREAKGDLIVATLAEADGTCASIHECAEHMAVLWGLTYDELELADALVELLRDDRVIREHDGRLELSGVENERLRIAARQSEINEEAAFQEWHEVLRARWPGLSEEDCQRLNDDLRAFLEALVKQHGAEAALLAYPDDPGARELLESSPLTLSEVAGEDDRERREWSLALFMRQATDSQQAYLAAKLNTAYFVAALTIDPDGEKLVQNLVAGQRVYLDTNFVYRLLGVQGPRYVRSAECILAATQAAGYECAVTPWTVGEYRASLDRSKRFLEKYPLPPEAFASVAADAVTVEDFVTSYWRQVKSTKLDVNDYVAFHMDVEGLLKERGIVVCEEGVASVDKLDEAIEAEKSILERVLGKREKHPDVILHDVKHRLLVKKLRGHGNRTVANAGYWFLTHDRKLTRYDIMAQRSEGAAGPKLQFCVSAGAWFQMVEAMKAKTADFDQTLADVVASSFIHPRSPITKRGAQAVVARAALHKDVSPELAARLFMNGALMEKIEAAQDPDKVALIDNAILASAKEAEAEAQAAVAKAQAIERDAAERIRDAERQRREELERAERRREEELRNEQTRADEAAKNTQARNERLVREQGAAHERELRERDELLEVEAARSARVAHRVRLAAVAILLAIVFTVCALAGVFDQAWQYFTAAVVLITFFAAVSAWQRRKGDR
jgi:hypothetical protein